MTRRPIGRGSITKALPGVSGQAASTAAPGIYEWTGVGPDPRTTGGMDMFNLAAGPILLVNPMSPATVFPSAGYFTDDDGERHPIYDPSLNVLAQLQQLNVRDLLHLDEMNVQGSERKIYLYGTLDALSRFRQTGGDIIHLADGTDWLVTQVLEKWDSTTPGQNPHWICVAVTQQIKGAQQLPTQRR